MRILVVEDDAKLRALVASGLVEEGYAIDVAVTGVDAVWRENEFAYDAVILDVGLPDIDGFEICHQIRKHSSAVLVFMLTALDDVDHRVRGLDVGADDYLVALRVRRARRAATRTAASREYAAGGAVGGGRPAVGPGIAGGVSS